MTLVTAGGSGWCEFFAEANRARRRRFLRTPASCGSMRNLGREVEGPQIEQEHTNGGESAEGTGGGLAAARRVRSAVAACSGTSRCRGRDSKNGYRYSEQALRRAARLYDQKPVFLDHAEKPTEAAARSTRDLVGSIVNPRFEEGRLRGDVRVLDTDSGRTFLALAEGNTPGVGMSHVVLAQRSVDGAIVERIEDVISVDVVVRPATTSTFRESEDGSLESAGSRVPRGEFER